MSSERPRREVEGQDNQADWEYPHLAYKITGIVAPFAFGGFGVLSLLNWYFGVGLPRSMTVYPSLLGLVLFIIGGVIGVYRHDI